MNIFHNRRDFIKRTLKSISGLILMGLGFTNKAYSQPVSNKKPTLTRYVDSSCGNNYCLPQPFGIPGVWK